MFLLIFFHILASNRKRIRLEFPKINAKFTGTGDLFTCLILAWLSKCPGDLTSACEKTISTLQAVLHRTQQCGLGMKQLYQS